jgi:hypothetical protein
MRLRANISLLIIAIVLVGITPTVAQSGAAEAEYELAIYLWGASLDGESGIGPLTVEVDAGFSDILDNLEIAGMAAFRFKRGRWAWMVDAQVIDLANDESPGLEVEADQRVFEVDLAYEMADDLEILAGARYVDVESRLRLETLLGTVESKAGDDWLDPLIGLRFSRPLTEKWSLTARGDVGGFGVGSNLTWNVVLHAGYEATEGVSVAFGYRITDFDYEDGSGRERFLFDVQSKGLLSAVVFRF